MPLQLDHTDMLSSTALFLESWTNIKGAKQLAKRLLKEQRMNLPLWNAYAQSELAKGNKDEARKVYMTALQSYPSFPPDNRVHAALLHRMFAQLEIDSGMVNRALCVLLSLSSPGLIASIGDGSSDSEPPVATSIVKGRKLLSQRLEAFFSGQKPFINVTPQSQAFIDTLYCHATVDLLTTTLDTAAAHYERALKSPILPCGAVRECVWHDYASLMFQHRERGVGGSGFRPALTREIIERAMAEEAGCWNNAVLWEMYGANEGQAKLENRLRRYLGQILDVHSTQMLWTFAVWSEVHHHSTANVNFIRSLFENALDGSG
ncbi:hypothetical protein BJ742DRAFT_24116 [Cladochytrium replicatum]|nr:hypothetical protein BJ742DRAFT_24116 [Cladochytrium replicatum]